MTTTASVVENRRTAPPGCPVFDAAGVAAHGVGRGDFLALVFSGSAAALGDVAGHYTWNTARKFVMRDPRCGAGDDFATLDGMPLPEWPASRVRPTPGVCLVFADAGHPAVGEMRARGGREFEHYVCLNTLTPGAVAGRRVEGFVEAAGERPVVLLGFGDQGRKIASVLVETVPAARRMVVDSSGERAGLAAAAGWRAVGADDASLKGTAVVSSPLARPRAFDGVVRAARREGRPVLDNALPWDERAELAGAGPLWVTGAVARCCEIDGWTVRAGDHGVGFSFAVVREDLRRVGPATMPHLHSGQRVDVGGIESCDLSRAASSDALRKFHMESRRAFVGIAGQSNLHDAALSIFATREFFGGFAAEVVQRVMPSEHRSALGATPFEHTVVRTTTGRSLGSPFMTACEQTAIGLLAAAYAAESPIVEIGSAIGGSTLLMAAATSGAGERSPIYSVDPDAPTRHIMRALFDVEGHAKRLRQVVETSDLAVEQLRHLAGNAGLVFIDGLHTYEAVMSDIRNYAPLVRKGGCIALHDADARFAGIYRAAAERLAGDPAFRPLCMVDTLMAFERAG